MSHEPPSSVSEQSVVALSDETAPEGAFFTDAETDVVVQADGTDGRLFVDIDGNGALDNEDLEVNVNGVNNTSDLADAIMGSNGGVSARQLKMK